MTKRSCATCEWWAEVVGEGQCHRHPPMVFDDLGELKSGWPPTKADEFCGEHKPKEASDELA